MPGPVRGRVRPWLKIVPLFLTVLMLGGIISNVAMTLGLRLTTFAELHTRYRMVITLSDQVIRYGAQGLLLTGIIYGVWTNWGFFRYRWVTVKWIIFLFQTIFGIVFIDRWMVENMSILEAEGSIALTNPTFLQNQWLMQTGAVVQIILLVFLIWVSVVKPWKKKAET